MLQYINTKSQVLIKLTTYKKNKNPPREERKMKLISTGGPNDPRKDTPWKKSKASPPPHIF